MAKQKVLSKKQMPIKLPVVGTGFWLLVMDKYNAPGWLWGVVITILSIVWIALIVGVTREQSTEIEELK